MGETLRFDNRVEGMIYSPSTLFLSKDKENRPFKKIILNYFKIKING